MTSPRSEPLRDVTGRRRSPATLPGFHAGRVPGNKGKRLSAEVYEPRAILKLLEAVPNFHTNPVHARGRALFAFLWRTGIRLVELPEIREADLNRSAGTVRIRRSGQRPARDVFLFGSDDASDWCWEQMEPWLAKRKDKELGRHFPLFCVVEGKTRGAALGAPYVRKALKDYARRAKLPGRFHPAGFRNTLAVELYTAELPVTQIQQQLGHSSVSVTQDLLERLGAVQPLMDLHDYRPGWSSTDA